VSATVRVYRSLRLKFHTSAQRGTQTRQRLRLEDCSRELSKGESRECQVKKTSVEDRVKKTPERVK